MLLAHPELVCPRCKTQGVIKLALSPESLLLVACQTCGDFDTRPGIQFQEQEFQEILNKMGWEKLPKILQGFVLIAEFLDLRNLLVQTLRNNPWVEVSTLGANCQFCQTMVLFNFDEELSPKFENLDNPKFRELIKEASKFLLQHSKCPETKITT